MEDAPLGWNVRIAAGHLEYFRDGDKTVITKQVVKGSFEDPESYTFLWDTPGGSRRRHFFDNLPDAIAFLEELEGGE